MPSSEEGAPEPQSGEGRFPQPLKYTAAITSSVSVITGLLFYFGASHAYWFFDYFGVNSTVLGLPPEEFLMRSVDGLFVPLVVLSAVAVLGVWLHRLADPLLDRLGAKARRGSLVVAAALGVFALVLGLLNALGVEVLRFHLTIPPLALVCGVGLVMAASRGFQRARGTTGHPMRGAVEWAGVFVLVSLGLFWAVHDYSTAAGVGRARLAAAGLPGYPDTVLFSEHDLNLRGPGVHERRCSGDESAYRYRYEGLKLVMRTGDMYLFLPSGWTRAEGAAIVLPKTDSVRFEFTVAGLARPPAGRC